MKNGPFVLTINGVNRETDIPTLAEAKRGARMSFNLDRDLSFEPLAAADGVTVVWGAVLSCPLAAIQISYITPSLDSVWVTRH